MRGRRRGPATVAARRRARSGRIQGSSLLLLLLAAAAGWLAYAVWPAIADNLEAERQLHAIANDAWRRIGERQIHDRVLDALAKIGSHVETPAGGQAVEAAGLPIDDDEQHVVVTCTDPNEDCSDSQGQITITVHYTRSVPLPGLQGKYLTLHFNPSAESGLEPPTW